MTKYGKGGRILVQTLDFVQREKLHVFLSHLLRVPIFYLSSRQIAAQLDPGCASGFCLLKENVFPPLLLFGQCSSL